MAAIERPERAAALGGAIDDLANGPGHHLRCAAPCARATLLAESHDEPTAAAHERTDAVAHGSARHCDTMKDDDARRIDIRGRHAVSTALNDAERRTVTNAERSGQKHRPCRGGARRLDDEDAHDLRTREHEVKDVIDREAVVLTRHADAHRAARGRVRHGDGCERHGGRSTRREATPASPRPRDR